AFITAQRGGYVDDGLAQHIGQHTGVVAHLRESGLLAAVVERAVGHAAVVAGIDAVAQVGVHVGDDPGAGQQQLGSLPRHRDGVGVVVVHGVAPRSGPPNASTTNAYSLSGGSWKRSKSTSKSTPRRHTLFA